MLKTSLNGVSMAYERSGQGKPLVLLHGYPLDHTIWEMVTPLLEKKVDLIVPDLRGFGESEVSSAGYSLGDMAADVARLLDQMKIDKAAIAGHSMGGYVALAFAHVYPERMAGLGLVASQAREDPPERKISRNQEADDILAHGTAEVAAAMSGKLTANRKLQAKLKDLILRQSPQGLANAMRAMAERPDSTPFLAQFDFPVVLIHGLQDVLIPVDRAREVKGLVKRGSLLEIEGAGHMPMLEAPRSTAGELLRLTG